MILQQVLLCALVLSVSADRPQWRKLEGDLEPEPVAELFQEVNEEYRLPSTTVPTHYNLHLRTAIHENNRQFQGTVEIFVNVLETTNTITIQNRRLAIWKVTLYSASEDGQNQVELGLAEYTENYTTEQLYIKHSSVLQPGSYVVKVEYEGNLQNNNNQGFFASSYLDDSGNRRYLASSKFEPTHARSAFPCFDEPKLKATFTLSITHHKDYNAVANMPQDGALVPDVDDPNYVTTKFQKSTKMSTYLLAFAVSDFRIRSSGIHTVYARPNVYDETEYPLQAGVDILNALSDYIGINYAEYMPKMTQIAIPDRSSGAMENWGLVTYGEAVLLFNPSINTYRTKTNVDSIIAHEFAHQWFGNLVSPDWWNYIWLNEGFATVYEYYAAQLAYPEARYWDLWNVEVIHNAFVADARETARPMTWNASTASEIAGLFDTIAYDKSGSVLNMFRVAFGDDNWREGLVSYFNKRKLDGAKADDLYEGLQFAVDGKNVLPEAFSVKDVMDSWTNFPGFPVLTVKRDYKTGEILLSQERFYSDRRIPNDHVYHVPYNYATKSAANFETLTFEWFSTKATKLTTTIPADDWIIFNKQQTSYFRVNYDTQNWQLIIDALQQNPSTIHVQNRAQLINDAYNLARSDRLDLAVPLQLMTYLTKETAYPPWAAASSVLTFFNNKLRGTSNYPNFINYVKHLLDPVYSTLSVDSVTETETLMDKHLKNTINTWSCRIGNQDCLTRTANALKQVVASNTPVHPDIAGVVYCYGLHHTDTSSEFVWMFERLLASKNQAERAMLIDSLGCSQNQEFLTSFLMTAFGSGATFNFLETERTRIVSSVYSASRAGVDALIDFLANEKMIDEFVNWLGQNTLNNAIANIASRTNNLVEEARLNNLLSILGDKVSASTISSARTTVANNFAWFHTLEGLVADEFFGHFAN